MGKMVAAYIRESRDEQLKNFTTLENQLALLKQFICQHPDWQLYDSYTDDNISGTTFVRPELNRLISDVEDGKIDIILLKDLSRLGRNNGRTLMFLDWAEEKGVQIVTTDGRYNSDTNTELAGIDTWFNERYAADISRKIRAVLQMKIKEGQYIGTAPYGYRKKSPGKLEPDPLTAVYVKEIYQQYLSGKGYSKIAEYLKEKGIPPPRTDWSPQSVMRILTSPVYIGTTVQGTSKKQSYKSKKTCRLPENQWTVTENTHEPIIDDGTFRKVQAIRIARRSGAGNNRGKIPVFKNLLYCGYCNSKMYSKGKGYICSTYVKNGSLACKRNFVLNNNLTEYILPILKEKILSAEFATESREDKAALLFKEAEKNCSKRLEILYNDRLKGIIDQDMYTKLAAKEKKMFSDILTSMEKEKKLPDFLLGEFRKETPETISPDMFRQLLSVTVEKCVVK